MASCRFLTPSDSVSSAHFPMPSCGCWALSLLLPQLGIGKCAQLWLLGSVAFIAFTMVLGAIAGALTGSGSEPSQVGPDITGNFLSLISLLLMPFIYRLATKEVDSRATGWSKIGKDVHYWPTIAITIILWLIGLVFSFIFVAQALNGLLADLDS